MISSEKKKREATKSAKQHFMDGLIIGLGWAFGVTIGFVIVSTVLVFLLRQAGGIPLIGKWFASIVDVTLEQLTKRTPIIPR